MKFNIDFELCALLFMIVHIINYREKKWLRNSSNTFFFVFAYLGCADLFFDIVTSVLISYPFAPYSIFLTLSLEGLYLMQVVIPFFLFLMFLKFRNFNFYEHRRYYFSNAIPFLIFTLLILTNGIHHWFFSVDSESVYTRGPMYLWMYLHALYYVIRTMIDVLLHHKTLSSFYRTAFWQFTMFTCIAIVFQIFNTSVMLTGVGIALSITVLFLTINNPDVLVDQQTDTFGKNGLDLFMKDHWEKRHKFHLIAVSLSGMKRINSIFGVEFGDRLLKETADFLKKAAGQDSVYRFLGDCFLCICPEISNDSSITEQILRHFQTPVTLGAVSIPLKTAIILVPKLSPFESPDQLAGFLNYALVQCKEQNTEKCLTCDHSLFLKYQRHLQIEQAILYAEDHNGFEVYYHPIYNVQKQVYSSAEALARLHHAEYGWISPEEFIGLAERNGDIGKISIQIFEKIAQMLSEHPTILKTLDTIKFNLSPAELLNTASIDKYLSIMKQYQLPGSVMQIELTETAVTLNSDLIDQIIQIFSEHQMSCCMDDFGSGYANLDAAINLPFQTIKLDRSLLLAAFSNDRARIMYEELSHTFHKLGLEIVAEGAETKEHVAFLKACGVDMIQGYYYSKPLSQADFLNLFQEKTEFSD